MTDPLSEAEIAALPYDEFHLDLVRKYVAAAKREAGPFAPGGMFEMADRLLATLDRAGRSDTGRYVEDEATVEAFAAALHEDCRLEWQAIAAAQQGQQITQHMADAHWGRAHDLIRRLALASGEASPDPADHIAAMTGPFNVAAAAPDPAPRPEDGLDVERLARAQDVLAQALPALIAAWDNDQTDNVGVARLILTIVAKAYRESRS